MRRYKTTILCILLITFIIIQCSFTLGYVLSSNDDSGNSPKKKNPKGNAYKDVVKPGQSASYQFSNNRKFTISSTVELEINIEYEEGIKNKEITLQIENTKSLSLDVNAKTDYDKFTSNNSPKLPENVNNEWIYGIVYRFRANSSIDDSIFLFNKSSLYGLNPEGTYSIAVYETEFDSWHLLSTNEISQEQPTINLLNANGGDTSADFLQGSLIDLQENTDYYITIFELKESPLLENLWWILIIIAGFLALVIIISKKDYIRMIKERITPVETGVHRLSLEDVLENQNRNKIIDIILKQPGIHFNELLRETELAPGNLVWHLDILETYKIIGKKRIGNFLAYFPYYQKNPISNIDIELEKSKLTLEILQRIEEKPGIWNSLITKEMEVDHKTIHYHVKKLIELGLIHIKKDGRKKKLYPNLDADYYQKRP